MAYCLRSTAPTRQPYALTFPHQGGGLSKSCGNETSFGARRNLGLGGLFGRAGGWWRSRFFPLITDKPDKNCLERTGAIVPNAPGEPFRSFHGRPPRPILRTYTLILRDCCILVLREFLHFVRHLSGTYSSYISSNSGSCMRASCCCLGLCAYCRA